MAKRPGRGCPLDPGDVLAGYAWGSLSGWAVARLVAGAAWKLGPAEDSRFSGCGID